MTLFRFLNVKVVQGPDYDEEVPGANVRVTRHIKSEEIN